MLDSRHWELVECAEGYHDNLTCFNVDFLCPACADGPDGAGVARWCP